MTFSTGISVVYDFPSDIIREWHGPLDEGHEGEVPGRMQQVEQWIAKALWILNASCKNYLKRAWSRRAEVVGIVSVVSDRVVQEPLEPRVLPLKPVQFAATAGYLSDKSVYSAWLGRRIPNVSASGCKPRSNFFTVFRGWSLGVMHRFCDVQASTRGFPGASFRGFDTLEGARVAHRLHSEPGQLSYN